MQSLVKEGVNLSRFCYFRGQAWTASLAKEGVIWSPFCYFAVALAVHSLAKEGVNLSLFCYFRGQAWTTKPCKRGCQLEPVLLFVRLRLQSTACSVYVCGRTWTAQPCKRGCHLEPVLFIGYRLEPVLFVFAHVHVSFKSLFKKRSKNNQKTNLCAVFACFAKLDSSQTWQKTVSF